MEETKTIKEVKSDAQQMAEARDRITDFQKEQEDQENARRIRAMEMPITEALETVINHDVCRVLATLLQERLGSDPEKGYRGIQDAHIALGDKFQDAQFRISLEMPTPELEKDPLKDANRHMTNGSEEEE